MEARCSSCLLHIKSAEESKHKSTDRRKRLNNEKEEGVM